MSIKFRVDKTKDYTVMSNHHLRNKSLTLKSKGLLTLMLSLPDDWDYTLTGLGKICGDGLSSIRTAIRELEIHGYLSHDRVRNEKGHFKKAEYIIREIPLILEINENIKKQPKCDFPTLENRTQSNTNISNIKESIINQSSYLQKEKHDKMIDT